MDSLVKSSLAEVASKTRSSVPWEPDTPHPQPFHTYINNSWKTDHHPAPNENPIAITNLAVLSWNIDFMLPFPQSRMSRALAYLQTMFSEVSTARVIFLQECIESDLKTISEDSWVRENFSVSDLRIENWQSGHYGTVTLIDRRLPIVGCFRVHYSQTRMERDGLFVDVRVQGKTVRLCNTHLESLALEPPFRPPQMKLCAGYMRAEGIGGAIAAGDFNAIQEFDRTLHSDNGLKDAFLESGGKEDDPKGHTWGQQAATYLREQFGTSRMDKVFYCGGLKLLSFEQFGQGVCVEDPAQKEQIVKLGFDEPWITDHLGVKAVFSVSS